MTSWSEADAQAQFGTVLDKADSEGPQRITRGDRVFYIMTRADWDTLGKPSALKEEVPEPAQNARTLSEFFENSPLVGSGIDLTRDRFGHRFQEDRESEPAKFTNLWDALEPPFEERYEVEMRTDENGNRWMDFG